MNEIKIYNDNNKQAF